MIKKKKKKKNNCVSTRVANSLILNKNPQHPMLLEVGCPCEIQQSNQYVPRETN